MGVRLGCSEMYVKRPLGIVLGLLAVAAAGPGARGAPDNGVVLKLSPYFRGLRTVRVESSAGPLRLLLDTGGGMTLVTPAVAARGGCNPVGRDVGHRMSGERVTFERCEAWQVSSGAWHSRVDPIGVFDVNALLPKELPAVDGLLALDAFRGRVLTLDWAAGDLTIHADADANRAARSALELRAATGDNGRFLSVLVPVASPRGRLWFLLDSGNIRGTLVSRHVVDAKLVTVGEHGEASLAIAGRPPHATSVIVDDLDIDGALGTDFLLNSTVTLDLRLTTRSPRAPRR